MTELLAPVVLSLLGAAWPDGTSAPVIAFRLPE